MTLPDELHFLLKIVMNEEYQAQQIEEKIQKRIEARKKKDWTLADQIRKELDEAGIQIKDNPDGTTGWSMG